MLKKDKVVRLPEDWPRLMETREHGNMLTSLTSSARSVFFGGAKRELLAFLRHYEAEYLDIPNEEGADGYVLYRHFAVQDYSYIVLKGRLHFYAPGRKSGKVPDDYDSQRHGSHTTVEWYSGISLQALTSANQYVGTLWAGQLTGLVEHLLGHSLEPNRLQAHGNYRQLADHLDESHLLDLRGRWLMSGFVGNGACILRLKPKWLLETLGGPTYSDSWKIFPELQNISKSREERNLALRTILLERCADELALRQAEQLLYRGLLSKGANIEALCALLYDHSIRNPNGESLPISRDELAWRLGSHDGDFVKRLFDDIAAEPEPVATRESGVVKFTPSLVFKRYRSALNGEVPNTEKKRRPSSTGE